MATRTGISIHVAGGMQLAGHLQRGREQLIESPFSNRRRRARQNVE